MYNEVILVGRVGKDIELKTSKAGKSYCSMSVATNSGFGDNRRTDWHNVVVFGTTAENCAKHVVKGTVVLVNGQIQYDVREKDGKKTTYTNILADRVTFLSDWKKQEQAQATPAVDVDNPFIETQDDLPF